MKDNVILGTALFLALIGAATVLGNLRNRGGVRWKTKS